MIRRLRAFAVYANAALVFLMLTGALFALIGATFAICGYYAFAASLIGAGVVIGAPPYCVLLARHINPEGHQK